MNRITTLTLSAALALSPLALTAPTYAAPAKAGAYTVTAKINKTVAIGKETTLKVRGRVTPKAAGQKVVLQQRVGNKKTWKATATAKIKANGTYVVKDDPSTPGKREYRVVKPASNGIAKGISPALAVQVYSWQRLGFRAAGPQQNLAVTGATIGTDYYPASLVTGRVRARPRRSSTRSAASAWSCGRRTPSPIPPQPARPAPSPSPATAPSPRRTR